MMSSISARVRITTFAVLSFRHRHPVRFVFLVVLILRQTNSYRLFVILGFGVQRRTTTYAHIGVENAGICSFGLVWFVWLWLSNQVGDDGCLQGFRYTSNAGAITVVSEFQAIKNPSHFRARG